MQPWLSPMARPMVPEPGSEVMDRPPIGDLPLRRIDVVAHVGTLDPADRAVANRASLEAFCLSVSHDPDGWAGIARIGGAPVWTLSRPGGLWLEANSLHDAQEAAIAAWALAAGHAERATLWRVWRFDDEADSWGMMIFDDHETALAEIDEDQEDDGPDGEPAIEALEGLRLTPAGMARLERWVDPCHAMDGLVILWANDVLASSNPDVVGIWWDDIDDPLSLSCPRGGILPARLAEFSRSPGWEPVGIEPSL